MLPYTPVVDIYQYILKRAYVGRSHHEVTARFTARYDADTRNKALNTLACDGKICIEERKPYKGPIKFHYYASEHAPKEAV